jgi:hypothetical protein
MKGRSIAAAIALAALAVPITGCSPSSPAWVRIACADMVNNKHQYQNMDACLAAAHRDGAY